MKRIAFLSLLLVASAGCMPRLSAPVQIFEGRVATAFDFRPFVERGFLFTDGPFQGAYEPRGYIELTFSPRTTDLLQRNMAQNMTPTEGWTIEQSGVQPLLDEMYRQAVALDADAVTGFTVEIERTNVTRAVYRVSGFAIRRK